MKQFTVTITTNALDATERDVMSLVCKSLNKEFHNVTPIQAYVMSSDSILIDKPKDLNWQERFVNRGIIDASEVTA